MKPDALNSLLHHAFGIKGYRHLATHFEDGEIVFEVEPESPPKGVKGEAWVRRGYRWRKVRSLSIGLKAVWIKVKIQRWRNTMTGAEVEHSPPLPAPTAK